MGLLDEISEQATKPKPCKIGRLLEEMDKADRDDLNVALADFSIPVAHIVAVLNRRGWSVGDSVTAKHRRKACCCVSR